MASPTACGNFSAYGGIVYYPVTILISYYCLLPCYTLHFHTLSIQLEQIKVIDLIRSNVCIGSLIFSLTKCCVIICLYQQMKRVHLVFTIADINHDTYCKAFEA